MRPGTRKHACDGIAAAREQLAATIAARLGVRRRDQAADFHFDAVDAGVHGRVCVRPGASDSVFTL